MDEEEVSGFGVEEEQSCVCGTAFIVLCASSLFVCMIFHFL